MTKALRKTIMKSLEVENKHVKNEINEKIISYKKQRNFCSKLYIKYYEKLDLKNVTNMNEFGNTIKLLLYDEVATFPKYLE